MQNVVTQAQLEQLAGFINDNYEGDLFAISRYLDNAIYMLGFLPEESFVSQEVQDVCFVLNNIKECFFEAHRVRSVSGLEIE